MVYVKMVNEKGKEKFKFRFFLFCPLNSMSFTTDLNKNPFPINTTEIDIKACNHYEYSINRYTVYVTSLI